MYLKISVTNDNLKELTNLLTLNFVKYNYISKISEYEFKFNLFYLFIILHLQKTAFESQVKHTIVSMTISVKTINLTKSVHLITFAKIEKQYIPPPHEKEHVSSGNSPKEHL